MAEAGEGKKLGSKCPRPFRWERVRVRAISLSGGERKLMNHFVVKNCPTLPASVERSRRRTEVFRHLDQIPVRIAEVDRAHLAHGAAPADWADDVDLFRAQVCDHLL